jgi:urea transport system substrate-binding protein
MNAGQRVLAIIIAALVVLIGLGWFGKRQAQGEPIRVGVLHSLTGTMAISEKEVVDATMLAIEELNRAGGLLGRRIEPVVVDGASDWPTFARAAQRLIETEKVAVVFGCWTSASRRTVKPVFESGDHLLIYPLQYEGLEQSPNIIYTGAAPNQQITPAVKWSFDHLGKRAYLVGSDYVFPRTANAIIRTQMGALGGEIVGELYLPLGETNVAAVVSDIMAKSPDVILNTINGDTNVAFFSALKSAGIDAKRIPTVSFSIAEPELQVLAPAAMSGHYAVWNYFQSVATEENRAFVTAFRQRYGSTRVVSDPMEAAYVGVNLWAEAVRRTKRTEPRLIREAIRGVSWAAPSGSVYVDPETQHLWKPVRVGQMRSDGQFDIVWSSDRPVRPIPYPPLRPRAEWDAFIAQLQREWKGEWARPQ